MKRTVILSAFIDRVLYKAALLTVIFVQFGLETSDRSKTAKCLSPRRGRKIFFPFYFLFVHTSISGTDLTAFGLYWRSRSRFSHTDLPLG